MSHEEQFAQSEVAAAASLASGLERRGLKPGEGIPRQADRYRPRPLPVERFGAADKSLAGAIALLNEFGIAEAVDAMIQALKVWNPSDWRRIPESPVKGLAELRARATPKRQAKRGRLTAMMEAKGSGTSAS